MSERPGFVGTTKVDLVTVSLRTSERTGFGGTARVGLTTGSFRMSERPGFVGTTAELTTVSLKNLVTCTENKKRSTPSWLRQRFEWFE